MKDLVPPRAGTKVNAPTLAAYLENQEIRQAVGEHLVASVEDLYNEIQLLQSIQDEYRDETQKVLDNRSHEFMPSLLQGSTFQRSTLLKRIDTMWKEVQQHPSRNHVSSALGARELQILNHTNGTQHAELSTPISGSLRDLDADAYIDAQSEDLIQRLRRAFEEEKVQLLTHIDLLQCALDGDRDARIQAEGLATFQVPTLQELENLCEKLEGIGLDLQTRHATYFPTSVRHTTTGFTNARSPFLPATPISPPSSAGSTPLTPSTRIPKSPPLKELHPGSKIRLQRGKAASMPILVSSEPSSMSSSAFSTRAVQPPTPPYIGDRKPTPPTIPPTVSNSFRRSRWSR